MGLSQISILAVYGVEGQWKINPRTQFQNPRTWSQPKFQKKNFCWKLPNYQIQDLKNFFTKKLFYRTLSNFVMGCVWSRRPINNLSSHSVLKSSDSYKKSSHSANFDIGRLWSRRPMKNLSSHSVLKSSHQKYFLRTQSNFDIGRLWSIRPIKNLSSHSVLKSTHS